MTGVVHIGDRFQGPTGSGQGGWTSHRFVEAVGRPLDVTLRAPIPLATDLVVEEHADAWELVDLTNSSKTTIMSGTAAAPIEVSTAPVSLDDAASARQGFGRVVVEHPVPLCFSCGLTPESMCVHAAPLADGTDRYAADWTVPEWARTPTGVDEGVLWAALDCAAAWYACTSRGTRTAFTVRLAVEVHAAIEAGGTYALVAWSGGAGDEWDGRKRHAASAAFAPDGTCVASSRSLWVSVDE